MNTASQDRLVFTRAELDAAKKDLQDCHERSQIAFDAYMDAENAYGKAQEREFAANRAWFEASRSEPTKAADPDGSFKALLISNRHLHELLTELLAAAKRVVNTQPDFALFEKRKALVELQAAIAKAEEVES